MKGIYLESDDIAWYSHIYPTKIYKKGIEIYDMMYPRKSECRYIYYIYMLWTDINIYYIMKLELGFKQNRRRITQAWSSLVHVLDIASTYEQWAILLLVAGFKHILLFTIYGIILPIDELIVFKIVKTTNQDCYCGGIDVQFLFADALSIKSLKHLEGWSISPLSIFRLTTY